MERTKSDYLKMLSSYVLALIASLGVLIPFLVTYGSKLSISVGALVIFTVVINAGWIAAYSLVRKRWIVVVSSLVLLGLIVLIFRRQVVGGICNYIDMVIDSISERFDIEMWYIDIHYTYARVAKEGLAVYLFVYLLTDMFCLCLVDRETSYVPAFFLLIMSAFMAVICDKTNYILLIARVLFCISLLIISTAACGKDSGKIFVTQLTSVVTGLVMGMAVIIATIVTPANKYSHTKWFENTFDRISNGEISFGMITDIFTEIFGEDPVIPVDIPGISEDIVSAIGGGYLGNQDEIKFSGEMVMKLHMPNKQGRYYIKGFIGKDYSNKRWTENKGVVSATVNKGNVYTAEHMKKILESNKYYSSDVYDITLADRLSGSYMSNMEIEYIGPKVKFGFFPMYILNEVNTFHPRGDYGWQNTPYADIGYVYISDNFLPYIDYYQFDVDPDEEQYRNYVYYNYLDVNTLIANELYAQWGSEVTETAYDRYVLACKIKNYLSWEKGFSYTTKPGKVPSDRDFLDYFMNETREGYCTYFATAAVMMFRSAGVPARYVEGYVFDSSNFEDYGSYSDRRVNEYSDIKSYEDRVVSIKDSNAHAWVEYYVDGVGWIDWEVTPGYGGGEYIPEDPNETASSEEETSSVDEPETTSKDEPENDTTDSTDENPTTERTTDENPATTHGTEAGTNEGDSTGTGPIKEKEPVDYDKIISNVLKILIPLIVVGIIVVVFWYIQKTKQRYKEKMYRKAMRGDIKPAILYIYSIFGRILKDCGIEPEKHMSAKQFADYLVDILPQVEPKMFTEIAAIYEKTVFSEAEVTEHDFLAMRSRLSDLYKEMQHQNNIFGRLICCIKYKNMI